MYVRREIGKGGRRRGGAGKSRGRCFFILSYGATVIYFELICEWCGKGRKWDMLPRVVWLVMWERGTGGFVDVGWWCAHVGCEAIFGYFWAFCLLRVERAAASLRKKRDSG